MVQATAYSAKNVAATVNGQAVQGLWDGDDAITIAPLADDGVMLVGADGSSIFSQSANEGATITLRLQHTSPTHRLLMQQLQVQRGRGVALTGFPVSIIDTDSQEGGSTDKAFIQTKPTDSKGVAAAVREWVIVTGRWQDQVPIAQ